MFRAPSEGLMGVECEHEERAESSNHKGSREAAIQQDAKGDPDRTRSSHDQDIRGVALQKTPSLLFQEKSLELSFRSLRYGVNVSKLMAAITSSKPGHVQILKGNGISGSVRSGEVMAMLGHSGAGKTTLLDILSYRIKGTGLEGTVTLNGQPLNHDVFSHHCTYVPQMDSLWSALTVRENLLYASRLYHPSYPREEHSQLVEDTLDDLGLTDCADVKIGNVLLKGVSGGQKRRTSIGVGLVAKRGVLFLDEPTSGLDAAAASSVMKHLQSLAATENLLIFASIHQPSTQVFYSFDKLLLLSRGRTAYLGKAENAMAFFTRELLQMPSQMINPADWILEISNAEFRDKDSVERILDYWEESTEAKQYQETTDRTERVLLEKPKSNSWARFASWSLYRVLTLIRRAWLNYMRDPASYLLRLVMILFMSFFLGAVYSGLGKEQRDVLDASFMIQWGLAFNSYANMVALPAFALERNCVNMEFANGQYRIFEYVLAGIVAQIPFLILMAILATSAFYWIPILNDGFLQYVLYCIIMFAQLFFIESLAILLGTTIKDDVLALAMFGVIVSVLFIFNDFFVSDDIIPVWLEWAQYISPFKYAWEALAVVVFEDTQWNPCVPEETCLGETGKEILDFFSSSNQNLNEVNVATHFAVMIALGLGLRLLVVVAFVLQHK